MSKPAVIYVESSLDRRIIQYVMFQQTGAFGACCCTYRHMAAVFGCCERTLRRHLNDLRRRGYLWHRGYIVARRGRLAVWQTLRKVRVVLVSFAAQVRAMSAFVAGHRGRRQPAMDTGGPETLLSLTKSWNPEQKRFRDMAIRRWGAGAVLAALDQVSGRYSAAEAMRVMWAILAGRC